MQHRDHIIQQIIDRLQECTDEAFLDFVLKLFIESGY